MLVRSNDRGETKKGKARWIHKMLTTKGTRINDLGYQDIQLWLLGMYVASPINMKNCKTNWQLGK
jgi:hypothetical protein